MHVRVDGPARHAVRVLAHERYEAWLIGWPPGHRTSAHDHGGSAGALVVVEGELEERRTARRSVRRLGTGDAVRLPADVVHDVGTAPDHSAVSLHVYSPPLSSMTFYDDDTGLPDRVLDVVDERPLLDGDGLARVLHPAGGGRG